MVGEERQEFKVLYSSVMTAAIYTGTFLACFFWPSFLAYLFFPEDLVRTELVAVFILLPLGLIILGLLDGFKIGLLHFVIVVVPVVASCIIIIGLGHDSENEFTKSFTMTVIALSYMAAAFLASKRRLKTYE
jgi:hypothetical protein